MRPRSKAKFWKYLCFNTPQKMSFLFQTFDKSLNFGESGKSWISNPFSTENFETKIQPSAYDVYVVIKKEKKKGCGFFSPFFEKIGEHVQNSQFCWKYYAPVKIILRITDACIVIAQLQNAMKIQCSIFWGLV